MGEEDRLPIRQRWWTSLAPGGHDGLPMVPCGGRSPVLANAASVVLSVVIGTTRGGAVPNIVGCNTGTTHFTVPAGSDAALGPGSSGRSTSMRSGGSRTAASTTSRWTARSSPRPEAHRGHRSSTGSPTSSSSEAAPGGSRRCGPTSSSPPHLTASTAHPERIEREERLEGRRGPSQPTPSARPAARRRRSDSPAASRCEDAPWRTNPSRAAAYRRS